MVCFSTEETPLPPMCWKQLNTNAVNPGRKRSSTRSSDTPSISKSFSNSGVKSSSITTNALPSSLSASLSSLSSLRESPSLYSYSDITSATNNFRCQRLSPTIWRCSFGGIDSAIVRRPFTGDPSALPSRLIAVSRGTHASIAGLLGATHAGDGYMYLVYRYIPGVPLSVCLRNSKNPNFTVLSSWVSRVQAAADLAQGLEYIHHYSSLSSSSISVHNRMKSSTIVITEPHLRAKILHYAAAELTGELEEGSGSEYGRIEGTRGYMAPELMTGSKASQKSDVYALGVVLLELVSGREPLQYSYGKEREEYKVESLVETAREAVVSGGVRRWVDSRLRDSFPVEAAEKLMKVGLRCLETEAGKRPDMVWVAGKVSKLLLESKAWEERIQSLQDFSVSVAPR